MQSAGICAFVFAYVKSSFSHGAAHNNYEETKKNYGNTGLFSLVWILKSNEPRHEKTGFLHMNKTKTQISFAKLISAFVFATRIVQSLYFLNPKFQASRHLLWLYSLVCVGPGRKPRRPVFSQQGSNDRFSHGQGEQLRMVLVFRILGFF